MSNFSGNPLAGNPYAPRISRGLYLSEKSNFAGILISAVTYGSIIVLFLRCISALLDPVNRRGGAIKWGLVAHTVAMFSFVTIYTATNLTVQSTSYIDNREFPGISGVLPSGPLSYEVLILPEAISVVPDVMFLFNNWLADGLLLYRCFVIYAKNYWVIAFPCIMYLASWATGVVLIYYQATQPETTVWSSVAIAFNYPYYSISLSLNILLTVMIVTRLLLHLRNIRKARGDSLGTGGIYKAIITILVESCAIYAVSSILFLGPWGTYSFVADLFFPILAANEVVGPFLITLRVANKIALTSNMIVSGCTNSMHFATQEMSTTGDETLTGGNPTGLMDSDSNQAGEPDIIEETAVSTVS